MRKTVDIDILVTSMNGDRKVMQYIRITSRPTMEVEPVAEPVQMNIYRSNTYIKDLSWLHFEDELRVQEKQQAKDK